MLSISHSLTGAFIASKLTHPTLYIPITLAFHYLQDWTPHWDVGTGLSKGKRKKSTAIILELFDLAITIGLIYFIWQKNNPAFQWHIWLAAWVALLPDFIEAPKNFLGWEPKLLKPINKFHDSFHNSIPNQWMGLLPQMLLIGIILSLK